jgi:hypothetical protein
MNHPYDDLDDMAKAWAEQSDDLVAMLDLRTGEQEQVIPGQGAYETYGSTREGLVVVGRFEGRGRRLPRRVCRPVG